MIQMSLRPWTSTMSDTSTARPELPVSSFIQIAIANQRAESPSVETASPNRKIRALRILRSFRTIGSLTRHVEDVREHDDFERLAPLGPEPWVEPSGERGEQPGDLLA